MKTLKKITLFLHQIGIQTQKHSVHWFKKKKCFAANIRIEQGTIHYNYKANIGDLLHEAGHLVLFPAEVRKQAFGDLYKTFRICGEAIEKIGFQDEVKMQAYMACDDDGATAWAWAVGLHLKLKPKSVVTNMAYQGDGAAVRSCLSTRYFSGIKRLKYAQLVNHERDYPNLQHWVSPY
jgi:hypothetical protein